MRLYRDNFKPSVSHDKPLRDPGHASRLRRHATRKPSGWRQTFDLNVVRRAKGEYLPLASPEDAAAYDYTPVDRARIAQGRNRVSVGSPATVMAKLKPLIEATKADELMVTTMIFDHEARKHSYELLAQAFGARAP